MKTRFDAPRPALRSLVVVILAAVLAVAGCGGKVTLTTDEVLSRVRESYGGLRELEAVVMVNRPEASSPLRFQMWFRKPAFYRTVLLEPETVAGQEGIYDGSSFWLYLPEEGRAIRYDGLPGQGPEERVGYLGELVEDLLEDAGAVLVGVEKIAGKPAYLVESHPSALPTDLVLNLVDKRLYWLDAETWMPVRVEDYDTRKNLLVSVSFNEIKRNPNLPEALFEPDFPPDTVVEIFGEGTEQISLETALEEADFPLHLPSTLPERMVLSGIARMGSGDDWAYLFRFEGGGKALELTQNRAPADYQPLPGGEDLTVNGRDYQLIEARDYLVLHWVHDEVEFSAVGNLSREQLLEIAASMRPASTPR